MILSLRKDRKPNAFQANRCVLDVLEAFPPQGIKEAEIEMVGTVVRRLIEINTEKENAEWRQDM